MDLIQAHTAAAAARADLHAPLFSSFFSAGFECSTQRLQTGRRLDLVSSTAHDRLCLQDYRRAMAHGMRCCREGLRWHLIEKRPYEYDFRSVQPMLRAARETGMQVIWDIFHFGWPDDLDIFQPAFVHRLRGLSEAFARLLRSEGIEAPYIIPVNEPSFVSWGGGDVACLNPFQRDRGKELKAQLTPASLASMDAVRKVLPRARFILVDPLIHIAAHEDHPEHADECRAYTNSQYQAWDMIEGREWPFLGGSPSAMDIVGVNIYPRNQWTHEPYRVLMPGDPLHKPARQMLQDVWERYRRPIYLSETGTEDEERGPWLRYICAEVGAALRAGVPIHGICLYPILNHPGWNDDRHCRNGLWDYADAQGNRALEDDLAPALADAIPQMEAAHAEAVQTHASAGANGKSH